MEMLKPRYVRLSMKKTTRKMWREDRREEGNMLVMDRVSCLSQMTTYLGLPAAE